MPVDTQMFHVRGKLPRGTQIVYVPPHIKLNEWSENVGLRGVEYGFVTSGPTHNGDYFCRYWRYDHDAMEYVPELRTKANSERTPGNRLVVYDRFNQLHVDFELKKIGGE
jgi:hypothetical protein